MKNNPSHLATSANTENNPKRFESKRVTLKQQSFELYYPHYSAQDSLQVETQLGIEVIPGGSAEDYDVILKMQLTGKKDTITVFSLQVQQVGEFRVLGMDEAERTRFLRGHCVTMLYPYASEAINNLLGRARLPLVPLDLVDFDAFYRQSEVQEKEVLSEGAEEALEVSEEDVRASVH